MQFPNRLILLLLSVNFFAACKKDNPDIEFPVNTNFVSATLVASLSKTDLDAKALKAGFSDYTAITRYDVDYYKLIYKTTFKNKEIQVSGLVGIPKNMPKAPSLLSAHHEEVTRFSDAPSNFPSSFTQLELFASAGFIELMPDYIGLGISSNIPQPFYIEAPSALTVIDMIKATKYFLEKKKIFYNSKLYLTGLAEGGYVTIAAQRAIQTDSSHNLSVTAAAEGGGALLVIEDTGFPARDGGRIRRPYFLPLLSKGYNHYYEWNYSYDVFFTPLYAAKIPSLLNGTKTLAEIDAQLTRDPNELLNGSTVSGELSSKATLNSVSTLRDNFVPKAPTRFYVYGNGSNDDRAMIFPFDRYGRYDHIQFFFFPGKPMLLHAMEWFIELDK